MLPVIKYFMFAEKKNWPFTLSSVNEDFMFDYVTIDCQIQKHFFLRIDFFFSPSEHDIKVRRGGVGRGGLSSGLAASAAEKVPAAPLLAFS